MVVIAVIVVLNVITRHSLKIVDQIILSTEIYKNTLAVVKEVKSRSFEG